MQNVHQHDSSWCIALINHIESLHVMHHVKQETFSSKTQTRKANKVDFVLLPLNNQTIMLRCSNGHQGDVLFMVQKNRHVYGRYKIRGP